MQAILILLICVSIICAYAQKKDSELTIQNQKAQIDTLQDTVIDLEEDCP